MVHPQRTSDEKRPGRGRQRINPREFTTTGPRTRETAANYLLHRDLRQDGGGDQRGVSLARCYSPENFSASCIEAQGKESNTDITDKIERPFILIGRS